MHARLLPNHVILRLPPGKGALLRAAALEASARGEEVLLLSPEADLADACAALGAGAGSGAFGPRELRVLQAYLDATAGGPARPSVKDMVAQAALEGLSAAELEARAAAEGAAAARRAALRDALQRSRDDAAYWAMLGKRSSGSAAAAAGGAQGLRAFAPQATLGAGLVLALASATLLGYFIGRNLFGAGSQGAWVLALIVGVGTLVLEATLLLLRLGRADSLEAARAAAAAEAAAARRRGGGAAEPAQHASDSMAAVDAAGSAAAGSGASTGLRRRNVS